MKGPVIETMGLIGAGHIESQIARLAASSNYNVVISNFATLATKGSASSGEKHSHCAMPRGRT